MVIIEKHPGVKANQISDLLDRPIKTIERQIKKLGEIHFIERRGSKKTGGYWLCKKG